MQYEIFFVPQRGCWYGQWKMDNLWRGVWIRKGESACGWNAFIEVEDTNAIATGQTREETIIEAKRRLK